MTQLLLDELPVLIERPDMRLDRSKRIVEIAEVLVQLKNLEHH